MVTLQQKLQHNATVIQAFFIKKLDEPVQSKEIYRPKKLIEAIRYGLLNGGKKLRPFFVFESTNLFKGSKEAALYVGAALEALHCYSLIHDDLPSMDNDDFRRGKPTIHKAFDEATAILVGDALLTFSFELLSCNKNPLNDTTKILLIQELAKAAGLGGMVGGQMMDMHLKEFNEQKILTLQTMKTALLFRFACEAGALISGASKKDQNIMAEFGVAIGLAFQLADDLLDDDPKNPLLGKTPGKDEANDKPTLVRLYGKGYVSKQLDYLIHSAKDLLKPYGEKAQILTKTADFIIERKF